MNCACPNCECQVPPDGGVEEDGKLYCCETCASECTSAVCVCTPCECPK